MTAVNSKQAVAVDKLTQVISVAVGFLKLIEAFHWYPDLISIISAVVTELIFGLKILHLQSDQRDEEKALIDPAANSALNGTEPLEVMLIRAHVNFTALKSGNSTAKGRVLELFKVIVNRWAERKDEIQKKQALVLFAQRSQRTIDTVL